MLHYLHLTIHKKKTFKEKHKNSLKQVNMYIDCRMNVVLQQLVSTKLKKKKEIS